MNTNAMAEDGTALLSTGRHGHHYLCNTEHRVGTSCKTRARQEPWCRDCGEQGCRTGHQECQYPQDHSD